MLYNRREQPNAAESELIREATILFPLRHTRRHSNDELHQLVRLLILGHTRLERRIIALHLYHRLPLKAVAEQTGMPLGRVSELYQSALTRADAARVRHANEERAARIGEQVHGRHGL